MHGIDIKSLPLAGVLLLSCFIKYYVVHKTWPNLIIKYIQFKIWLTSLPLMYQDLYVKNMQLGKALDFKIR